MMLPEVSVKFSDDAVTVSIAEYPVRKNQP
jgi:hypothetical protein